MRSAAGAARATTDPGDRGAARGVRLAVFAGVLLGAAFWPGLRLALERADWSARGGLAASASPASSGTSASATDATGWSPPGTGFVVWESKRSGRWRLWTQRLDGSGLRQLSPEEGDRIHCCPHVAPDGSAIAWLSLEPGPDRYPEGRPQTGVLRLMRADGSGDRVLAPLARTYGEHRAAVWHGPRRLLYIDGEGYTVAVDLPGDLATAAADLAGARRERLTRQGHAQLGWLIDPSGRHAVAALPTFSLYDPRTRAVTELQAFGGCQPYFSPDGRWGYWTAGAGGPLHKIELATRRVSMLVAKSDPRLPGAQGYLYFPMLSSDQRLLAFAASDGGHDHWTTNYDVHLIELDPERLEPVGRAVRVAPHPAPDRFPDVWVAPLPLGVPTGEAPFTVRLAAPGPGDWRWSLGDGTSAAGSEVRHTFPAPGAYAVEARDGERAVAGRVRVLPSRPPRVEQASLRNERTIVLRFDEPVDLAAARFSLASGVAVNDPDLAADGREVVLALASPLRGTDTLRIAGVRDRAGQPNTMAPAEVPLDAAVWPSRRDGLLFVWETAAAPNRALDPTRGVERSYAVERTGTARLDHHHRMRLGNGPGAFVASPEAGEAILAGVSRHNEISLEATLLPAAGNQQAAVVAFSGGGGPRNSNVVLAQQGGRLALRLSVALRGVAEHTADLGPLAAGEATHVLVSYRPGRLQAFRDGRQVVDDESVQGDFFRWRPRPLHFGGERGQAAAWRGTLEGVAFYGRALGAEEAAENARRYQARAGARSPAAAATVTAVVLACSPTPTLQEISPYREALAVHSVRLEGPAFGLAAGTPARVARWVLLAGERQPAAACTPGTRVELELERHADNPQLESVFLADTVGGAGSGPLLYDAGS